MSGWGIAILTVILFGLWALSLWLVHRSQGELVRAQKQLADAQGELLAAQGRLATALDEQIQLHRQAAAALQVRRELLEFESTQEGRQ